MIKKAFILALAVFLLVTILSPALAQARGGIKILDSSTEVDFPLKLGFSLSAESDVNITDIRLHYTVDRERFAEVTSEVYIEFTPSTRVDASWDWDMRKTGGLPPGSSMEYWWTVKDASGSIVRTTPVQVQFDDNRYLWRNLTKGKVTIYWYEGERTFAEEIMFSVEQALARLANDTGAHLEKPARIYIYASSQDLRGAMIYPQEWTGGVAFTRYGTIAIGISQNNLDWGKRAIAHEMTHLVIHQITLNPYSYLPTWLEEGLAMHNEGELLPTFASFLNMAIEENSLISVRSLSSPFSAYTEQSYLSYAQSYSLVEFLIRNYGKEKMLELLDTFSEGNSYDGALQKVYGFDTDGLDALWRKHVRGADRLVKEEEINPAYGDVLATMTSGFPLVLGLAVIGLVRGRDW